MEERSGRPPGIWVIVVLELFNAGITLVDLLGGYDLLRGGVGQLTSESEAFRWVVILWSVLVLVAAVWLWLLSRRGWALMMVLVGVALAVHLEIWWTQPERTQWLRLAMNVVVAFYLNSAQVRGLFLKHGHRIVATLTLIALLAMPGAATSDPARTFLMTAFNLSAADIGRLDRGEVVSRTLEVKNRREVATLGIVRIKTSPSSTSSA